MNSVFKLTAIGVAVSLAACSTIETEKVDYRSASTVKVPSLDVPPDLTQLSKDTHYAVVGGAVVGGALLAGGIPLLVLNTSGVEALSPARAD